MLNKIEDLDQKNKRMEAYWNMEVLDRGCISVTAPGGEMPADIDELISDHIWWQIMGITKEMTPHHLVKAFMKLISKTHFMGEALPVVNIPGNILFTALGGKGEIREKTIWVEPTIRNCGDWEKYRFDPENQGVRKAIEWTRILAREAPGNYLMQSTGCIGALDTMAIMEDTSQFYMDLVTEECEDAVKNAHRECLKGCKYYMEEMDKLTHDTGQKGFYSFPGIYAPRRINFFSADWSGSISPRLFEKWMVPEIETMAGFCPYSIYHLDGPEAVKHLPMIAEVKELNGIQYIPGAGNEDIKDALPVYKKIQQLGKVQWILEDFFKMDAIMQELSPEGVFIVTRAPDREAAEGLLKKAKKWT